MLTRDALLHHLRKQMFHGGDRRLRTLISYVLLFPLSFHHLASHWATVSTPCLGKICLPIISEIYLTAPCDRYNCIYKVLLRLHMKSD